MANLVPSTTAKQPIGVFDSGIGGITVLRTLQQHLPHERFIYFADLQNLPYGDKAPQDILGYATTIISWLVERKVKLVVMACNTSSAVALPHLAAQFAIPIFGLIEPTAVAIAAQCKTIGILATAATAKSAAYQQALLTVNPSLQIHTLACPELVPLIEANKMRSAETKQLVNRYIQQLLGQSVDCIVYGCTHYPHLGELIQPLLPPSVSLVDPATYVARAVDDHLQQQQLHNKTSLHHQNPVEFHTSGEPHILRRALRNLGW